MNTEQAMAMALQFHNAGKVTEASNIYKAILESLPEHPQALHLQGVVAMQCGNLDVAKDLIGRAITVKPDYAEAHNNLGSVLNALQQPNEAVKQFETALKLNPKFTDALQNLAVIYQSNNKFKQSLKYINQVLDLAPKHVQANYLKACNLRQLGRLDEARDVLLALLKLQPEFLEAANELGLICLSKNDVEQAIDLFTNVLSVRPKFFEAQLNLVLALAKSGTKENIEKALAAVEKAIVLNPNSESAWRKAAELYREQGDLERALAFCDQGLLKVPNSFSLNTDAATLCTLLERFPQAIEHYKQAENLGAIDVSARYNLAYCYEKTSALTEAIEQVDKVLNNDPNHIPSIMLAAILQRRAGDTDAALETLKRVDQAVISKEDKVQVQFEFGKLRDKKGESDLAFKAFSEANQLLGELDSDSDKTIAIEEIREYQNLVSKDWLDTWLPENTDSEFKAPVFLVGFPRSGTTMLDQILDSHPSIQVLEERPILQEIESQIMGLGEGKNYLELLPQLDHNTLESYRSYYFARVGEYMEVNKDSIFVDKLPLNIKRIPLIKRLFPEAKIILALRHPCDVVLSNFMQYFRLNNAMSNFLSIEDTINYYEQVMGLWLSYAEVFDLEYAAVKYEDLVDDIQEGAQSVLKFLELDWDESMENFHQHAKSRELRTPSYQQVTQPIYKSASNRWRRYEAQLAPYKSQLKNFCDCFGYDI